MKLSLSDFERRNFLILTFAGIINAIGVTIFLAPVKLYDTGIMVCIGRSDFQVKINGFRIEIGEIQSKILNYPNIKDCYVAALDIKGTKVLCAYYVGSKNIDEKSLKSYLQKLLPMYMVPKYYISLNEIPLTGNGKVNKHLLPAPVI